MLKVMFGAIVTAMVLLFTMIGLGVVNFSLVWVNPTYLWSGIVGGLIMGVGFIVGGFCPALRCRLGFHRKNRRDILRPGRDGRHLCLWRNRMVIRLLVADFRLPGALHHHGLAQPAEWRGCDGIIVAMALFMFWGGEHLEHIFGGRDLKREPRARGCGRWPADAGRSRADLRRPAQCRRQVAGPVACERRCCWPSAAGANSAR